MIVKEFPKNSRETLRISIEEFHGSRFADCRVYYMDSEGVLKPTRKGVSLGLEILGSAIEGLQEVEKALKNCKGDGNV